LSASTYMYTKQQLYRTLPTAFDWTYSAVQTFKGLIPYTYTIQMCYRVFTIVMFTSIFVFEVQCVCCCIYHTEVCIYGISAAMVCTIWWIKISHRDKYVEVGRMLMV
jgi:hypothetical protein